MSIYDRYLPPVEIPVIEAVQFSLGDVKDALVYLLEQGELREGIPGMHQYPGNSTVSEQVIVNDFFSIPHGSKNPESDMSVVTVYLPPIRNERGPISYLFFRPDGLANGSEIKGLAKTMPPEEQSSTVVTRNRRYHESPGTDRDLVTALRDLGVLSTKSEQSSQ